MSSSPLIAPRFGYTWKKVDGKWRQIPCGLDKLEKENEDLKEGLRSFRQKLEVYESCLVVAEHDGSLDPRFFINFSKLIEEFDEKFKDFLK